MKNQNKYYILIYSEQYGIVNSLESSLIRYSIPHKRNYNDTITEIKYQNLEYSIKNYPNQVQREVLHKKGIETTRMSRIEHQYLEIEIHNNSYLETDYHFGLPQIIYDRVISSSKKPIYHFNFLTQKDMNNLIENYEHQFINRLSMAKFIEAKPEKILANKILIIEENNDAWILRRGSISKQETDDPRLAWFSIGEQIGCDGWGMTALTFTPIKIHQLIEDLNSLNYNQYIKDFTLKGISNEAKILSLKYDKKGENCSCFIDNIHEFKYQEISRIF